jgi:hypothetical protein
VSQGGEHLVVIERRGRSHRARCACGWSGHAWNELRPSEADAWHHIHGSSRIVDVSAVPDRIDPSTDHPTGPVPVIAVAPSAVPAPGHRTAPPVAELTSRARALADSPSPYGRQAVPDLWMLAAEDPDAIQAAISEIGELLLRHSRRSSSTADSEWLQLITAKRLLQEALEHEEIRTHS